VHPKVDIQHVTKVFERRGHEVTALDDVSCQIDSGEFVALVGASGCGKTTLLRLIDGLEQASSGQLLLDGRELTKPGPDRGFVFQQDTLFPWRTILKNVSLGGELQGQSRRERLATARRFIDLVGLKGFENHYPHELSGGMRQRANLARAFAVAPDVLLMDEPFASLDAQTREIMQSELLRIWSADARTVVFVTHQIDEAIFLADRVIVLTARPGRIKTVIPIDLPRPRTLAMKRTPAFTALVDQIWRLIEEEVRASMDVRGFDDGGDETGATTTEADPAGLQGSGNRG
jgi:NitT/TauT family transport system ATP-binding protein